MVLTAVRTPLAPALIVPDEQTWTLSGTDPAGRGIYPVFAPGAADRLLVPPALPRPLQEALDSLVAELPPGVHVETVSLQGMHGDHADHDTHGGRHDHHDMAGDHDHHDMMAIVGEPSADGLVMEAIELRFGPLGTPLPGGLAVDVTLDGDVVAESSVRALLGPGGSAEGSSAPDPLAPIAWTIALESGGETRTGAVACVRVAALESERAVSHLAWLRAMGRVLGWQLLVDRCTFALEGLPPLGHQLLAAREPAGDEVAAALPLLERALACAEAVAALVGRSRLLRLRTAGLAVLTRGEADQAGLRGPAARAAGLADDARSGHPLYERLGFRPIVHSGGDAYARALVRAQEAPASLRLACAALRRASEAASDPAELAAPGHPLEGPRGPLRAELRADGPRVDAPGSEAALRVAGEAMLGAEWAAALVALASFDVSPWSVAG